MKKTAITLLLLGFFIGALAQDVNITQVNDIVSPAHTDNIGNWDRGTTFRVQGTYTSETATSVTLRLLTFVKDTWTNPTDLHEVIVDNEAPFSGVIDSEITIPEDYEIGNAGNTQMLQVRVDFDGFETNIHNFFLSVTDPGGSDPEEPVESGELVDFDAEYGTASGSALVSNIGTAMAAMNEGDTLLFKSASYNFFGNSLTVAKGIVITGKRPTLSTSEEKGAYDVTTVFENIKRLGIASDDVTIANVELSADASANYVFTDLRHPNPTQDYYENLLFYNVIFRNGRVQVFGGNGADVDFTHASFLDFSQGGYYTNRSESIDTSPQFNFSKCYFKPDFDEVNFNVRALSIDAGNTEYPVVWNQNNSTIDDCLLDGTGLGIGSKTSYISVTNSHFKGYRLDVDMVHVEEFSHHVTIDGNTFEHVSPARTLYIDREMQTCHDIQITNNKWVGTYGWIISSYSPYNLTFENNDFSEAQADDPTFKTIDFTFHQPGKEPNLKYELPSNNLVVRNNTGLNASDHGILAYYYLTSDDSNVIDYPSAKVEKHEVEQLPRSLVYTEVNYRIKNKQSGGFIAADNSGTELIVIEEAAADSSDLWEISYAYPYNYHFKNVKTGNYMEVYRGYNLNDVQAGSGEQIFVEQKSDFPNTVEYPVWFLRQHEASGLSFFEILPGTNERKSRIVEVNGKVELELARVVSAQSISPPEDDSSWFLEPDGEIPLSNRGGNAIASIYPNPAVHTVSLQFEKVLSNDGVLSIIDFSGRKVISQPVKNGTSLVSLDVTSLPKGSYLIQIASGKMNNTFKLVINR